MRKTGAVIRVVLLLFCVAFVPLRAQDQPAEDAGKPKAAASNAGWPREVALGDKTVTIYQPQIEKWEDNRLECRAAVSIQTAASPQPTFGVVRFSARTDVDKESGFVTLDDLKVLKTEFPKESETGTDYAALLADCLPDGAQMISLARLEANLAVTQAEQKQAKAKAPLKNDPPNIIYSTTPAILVLIDGKPVLRPVEGTNLLRVINTRALILLDQSSGGYYLRLQGHWMGAAAVEGPWETAQNPPDSLQKALDAASASNQVDLLDKPADAEPGSPEAATIQTVYVSTAPAELIQTQGTAGFAPIDGTLLLEVRNSKDHIFMDTSAQKYYVLISGRWFRSASLKGPWEFVRSSALPADFAKIPENHPQGDVLVSVAGTPQAQEALIENDIPQTATVLRSQAKFTPVYDGEPQFKPIEGTPLQYAVNSPAPVIRVSDNSFYAVDNGVWFTAASPAGPWQAATSVPEVIYTIPPSSPLYYVTYVHIYGATEATVYTGYQPGYLGTCVSDDGTVVYGTGYDYPAWTGSDWYGPPETYGFGAGFCSGLGTGFCLGFAAGHWWHPWWGPYWGWHDWHDWHHRVYANVNNTNIYNHWGKNVIANRGRPIVHPVTSGRGAHGDVYAGHDGKVYQRRDGQWHSYEGKGDWKPVHEGTLRAEGMEGRVREGTEKEQAAEGLAREGTEKPRGEEARAHEETPSHEFEHLTETPRSLDHEERSRAHAESHEHEFEDYARHASHEERFRSSGGFHESPHFHGGFHRR